MVVYTFLEQHAFGHDFMCVVAVFEVGEGEYFDGVVLEVLF
jgi:hypothetical protein